MTPNREKADNFIHNYYEQQERIRSLETHLTYSATKEDLDKAQRKIEEKFEERISNLSTNALDPISEKLTKLTEEVKLSASRTENRILKFIIGSVLILASVVSPIVEKIMENF